MKTFTRLLELLAPFRWWIALSVLLGFATTGSGVGLMAMSAYLISRGRSSPQSPNSRWRLRRCASLRSRVRPCATSSAI